MFIALLIGGLLSVLPVQAQRISTQHFITASLAGGAGLGTSCPDGIKPAIGGDGQVALSYEVLHRGFFFSFGVGADYRLSRYKLTDGTVEFFPRLDKDGQAINYRYVYNNYLEKEHTISVTAPIWFGYRVQDKVYFAVGAKISAPLWNTYSTKTDLYTEGEYPNLIEYVSRDVPSYGFYPTMECKQKGVYSMPSLMVSPMAEIGGFFRIVPGFSCRLGAYVEYAIPVMGSKHDKVLVDYSAVDVNPATQTQENLQANIRFNSILDSRMSAAVAQYISFGIRATFRFNVTRTPSFCMCETDN